MNLSRRNLLLFSGAATISAATAKSAQAAVQCTQFNRQGVQQCQAGVRIGNVITAQQGCPNWCWAACVQTIFGVNGYDVYQEEIVARLYPNLACSTATGIEIANATAGRWIDRRGYRFRARVTPLLDLSMGLANSNAAAQVASELASDRPVINGAMGHATVLTAMTYLRDQFGRGMPQQITVRDPWPGNRNRRTLSPQEARGTFFIAAVRVS